MGGREGKGEVWGADKLKNRNKVRWDAVTVLHGFWFLRPPETLLGVLPNMVPNWRRSHELAETYQSPVSNW